jgi:multidrug efflux system membrane fusion protein
LTAVGQPPVIGPDHQLPAHVPVHRWPRFLLILLLAALAVAAAIAVVAALRRRAAAARAPAPPPKTSVTTSAAKKGDIPVYLEAIGTVTPVYTASVTSQVAGLVVGVHYKEGQHVEKGDPLVDVDSRPYRATLLQAQGVLERDEHVLAEARMDLERYRAAWARKAIAKQTLDDQEKVVLQDMGTVKNDRGTVDYDQVQVSFCHITAPFAGRVGLRLVDPGNVVQANGTTVLVVVTQIEPITVVFSIPEDSLGPVRARLDEGAQLAVDALDRTAQKKLATGTLLTIDNLVDTTTGTVKARAQFENRDDALFPNQFVNARLLVDTRRDVTLVPSSALQQNGAAAFVYLVQGGVAHMRTVKLGVANEGVAQVDGIDPGDLVATSGFDRLHEGAQVTVSSAPLPDAGGDAAP